MDKLTVILLPGLDGTGLLFRPLLEELPSSLDIEVISLDKLNGSTYHEQAIEIASTLTNQKLLLVAESYSGRIAYELCEQLSKNITGIVFIASFIDSPSVTAKLAKLIPVFMLKPSPISKWLLGKMGFSGFGNKALVNRVFESLAIADKHKLKARLKNISNLSAPTKTYDISCVYIQPSTDLLVSSKAAQNIKTVFPNTELVSLQGGHFIAQSNPAGCAKVIQNIANLKKR